MSSETTTGCKRGLLIAIEGCDRSGKSTQCKNLLNYFTQQLGETARIQRFPDRSTIIGNLINEYLQGKAELSDQVSHLLFSANRWECVGNIEKDLDAGVNIILDRYHYSGTVFSMAKGNNQISWEWCLGCDQGLPVPDVKIFMDLDPEAAALRADFGQERFENVGFQIKVRNLFHELMKRDQIKWAVIDASKTCDIVFENILAVVFPENKKN